MKSRAAKQLRLPDGSEQPSLFTGNSSVSFEPDGFSPSTDQVRFAEALRDELFATFPVKKRPTIEWRRFRTTAGTASFTRNAIALNAGLLIDGDRLAHTLKHEYAHLLAFNRAGRNGRGHGEVWQKAMRDLGLDPVVKHRYECAKNKSRQQVHYVCKGCGTQFIRPRRLPRNRKYLHVGCGGELAFQVVTRLVNP